MKSAEARGQISDGTALRAGSLVWPRAYFPTLQERAGLVAEHLPSWAIASGTTAGWVWTGMGDAQPWSVLRPLSPAPSPLEREHWKAGAHSPHHQRVVIVSGLKLLDRNDTLREILFGDGPVDAAATQLLMLTHNRSDRLWALCTQRRSSPHQKHHARRVLERFEELRQRHPDITR